ncbi:formate/nitrite transporter family protein [Paludibacterium yongneupense]|uniref:formate/nitrite transporter family protein n=1 Tax=Paludibacterium yongneupense TaxID=400061 RepID=UPI0006866462|nr:formate/nitrite transporter family protein [Paludibacterium yongneupense]
MSHPQALPYVVGEAANKQKVLNTEPLRYFLSAMMAGALIAVVLAVAIKLGQAFYTTGTPVYYASVAGFFGVALVTIIVCKVELFTSNIMYFSVGVLARQTTVINALKSWMMVYLGNLAGVVVFAWVFAQAGALGALPKDNVLFQVLEHKIHADTMTIFWRGVLCNWIICLAVWVPMRLVGDSAKVAMTMFLVFVFFFAGYEHSIANMAFFALGVLQGSDLMTWPNIVHNLIPATLGNIVGGGVGVGLVVFLLDRHTLKTA